MAAVKFNKDSKEWQMFTDFWKICQKYWEVEITDGYWEGLVGEMRDFYNKYKDIELAKEMIMGFKDVQERALETLKK